MDEDEPILQLLYYRHEKFILLRIRSNLLKNGTIRGAQLVHERMTIIDLTFIWTMYDVMLVSFAILIIIKTPSPPKIFELCDRGRFHGFRRVQLSSGEGQTLFTVNGSPEKKKSWKNFVRSVQQSPREWSPNFTVHKIHVWGRISHLRSNLLMNADSDFFFHHFPTLHRIFVG